MAKKLTSQKERLDRIARNWEKMDAKARKRIRGTTRGYEIIRHATGTESGVPKDKKKKKDK